LGKEAALARAVTAMSTAVGSSMVIFLFSLPIMGYLDWGEKLRPEMAGTIVKPSPLADVVMAI
jgi:hypothetical protein